MRGASLLWEEGVYLREKNYTCTVHVHVHVTSHASTCTCMNTILKVSILAIRTYSVHVHYVRSITITQHGDYTCTYILLHCTCILSEGCHDEHLIILKGEAEYTHG